MYLSQKAFLFAVASVAFSQTTQVDLRTQGKAIDFTNATATRPVKSGTALPAICQVAELFLNTNAPAGSNLFACTATNTWTAQAGGGGGAVSSVFTRAGAVVASAGDYTAAQITNAVDSTGSYSNPGWLAALAATKLTGQVPVANGGTGTATPALVAGANVTITGSWPNQTISSTGGGGGGGTSVTTILPVSQSGTTTLSVGTGCSPSTPCNVRFGNTVYSFQSSASVAITSGAGIAFIYISSSGLLTVGHNMSLTCSAGCVAQTGVSAFPTDSIPLYSWSSTAGAWDASGGIDYRASLSSKNFACGTGLICSESGGLTTAVLDPTAIPAGGGSGSTGGSSVTNLNGIAGMATSICTLTGYCSDSSGRASFNLTKPLAFSFHLAAPMTFNSIGFQVVAACTSCALRIAVLQASNLAVMYDTGSMSDASVTGADLTTPGVKKSPSTLTTLAAGDYVLAWATNSNALGWIVTTSGSYYIRNPFWASSTLSLGTAGVFSGATTGSGASFAFPGSFGTIAADPDELLPYFLFIR